MAHCVWASGPASRSGASRSLPCFLCWLVPGPQGPGSAAGDAGAASMAGGFAVTDRAKLFHGKQLVMSATAAYKLASPFIIWCILLMVVYGVSYSNLESVPQDLSSVKLAQKALTGVSRVTYYALRTALEPVGVNWAQ